MHPPCRIRWIDDQGQPTPDDNESIGYVYCEAYSYTLKDSMTGKISFPQSDNYPICATHREQVYGFAMRHWHFVPWPTEGEK